MYLSAEQYDDIMREYEHKRRDAVHEQKRRYEELIAGVPGYALLEERVSAVASGFAASLREERSDTAAAKAELARIREERVRLLTAAGYPADYLENVYHCPLCQDTGHTASGEQCVCLKARIRDLLLEQSQLKTLAGRISFDTLREDVFGEDEEALQHFRGAREEARRFCSAFPAVPKGLLFMGNVGTGKTALSVCVARELIEHGYSVLYFSAVTLFDRLAREHFGGPDREREEDLFSELRDCDLLVIDDLGTELTNSFVIEQLFCLLSERGIRDRRMVISTNLGLPDLQARYEDRIFSRMTSGFTMMRLTGPDIRQFST